MFINTTLSGMYLNNFRKAKSLSTLKMQFADIKLYKWFFMRKNLSLFRPLTGD